MSICRSVWQIVECPGFHTDESDNTVAFQIVMGERILMPGPHAILFVISLRDINTHEVVKTFNRVKAYFGVDIVNRMIVLFTHGDDRRISIESYMNKMPELNQHGGQYVVFNNEVHDAQQVDQLLNKIDAMGEACYQSCYPEEANIDIQRKIEEITETAEREEVEATAHGRSMMEDISCLKNKTSIYEKGLMAGTIFTGCLAVIQWFFLFKKR